MRTLVLILLALLTVPRLSSANAILDTFSDGSLLSYGDSGALYGAGFPAFSGPSVSIDGVVQELDWEDFGSHLDAMSGPLLSKTSETLSGQATTTYQYDGGLFSMAFSLKNFTTGQTLNRTFTAPIVGLMTLTVLEEGGGSGDAVRAFFMIGAGLLDADLASALGVRRKTTGGFVDDPWLTDGTGDEFSVDRSAEDGGAHLRILVPEPSVLVLMSAGGVALLRRARREWNSQRLIR